MKQFILAIALMLGVSTAAQAVYVTSTTLSFFGRVIVKTYCAAHPDEDLSQCPAGSTIIILPETEE